MTEANPVKAAPGVRYRFLPNGKARVLTLGQARQQNFWLFDLATRHLRQLTDLRRGFDAKSFDYSLTVSRSCWIAFARTPTSS